jgi:hypothetical protein
VQGELAFQVLVRGQAYLSDSTQVTVQCFVFVSRNGQYLSNFVGSGTMRSTCTLGLTTPNGATGLLASTTSFDSLTFPVFSGDSAEMRVSSITGALTGNAGTLVVNNLVIRVSSPGGRLLDEPAPAFRP